VDCRALNAKINKGFWLRWINQFADIQHYIKRPSHPRVVVLKSTHKVEYVHLHDFSNFA
jgi:hypothetical protein